MAMKKLDLQKDKKGMKAVAARKTKTAQSMGMGNIKAKKSAMADTKRKTAEGIKASTKKKLDNKRKTGFYEKP
jgi:hypothetical protein